MYNYAGMCVYVYRLNEIMPLGENAPLRIHTPSNKIPPGKYEEPLFKLWLEDSKKFSNQKKLLQLSLVAFKKLKVSPHYW